MLHMGIFAGVTKEGLSVNQERWKFLLGYQPHGALRRARLILLAKG